MALGDREAWWAGCFLGRQEESDMSVDMMEAIYIGQVARRGRGRSAPGVVHLEVCAPGRLGRRLGGSN